MAEGSVRLLFLADPQLGCMATFSGQGPDDMDRFRRRRMCVREFDPTDSLAWDVARLTDVVGAIGAEQPDLVVVGGDMIDETSRPDQLEAFLAATEASPVPLRFVPGNHDICTDANVPDEASLEWYRSTFGPEHETVALPVGDGATATFITVNSAVLDQPRKLPGAFEAEMAWLEGELAAAAPGPIVVFSHHPPFVDEPDEEHSYWNLPIERRRPFIDLLGDHGVDLLLCGHRHRNDHATYRGVEIVTSAAAGFPLGYDPPGYRIVEVSGDGVAHAYYGLDDPGWDGIGGPPVAGDC